MKQHINRNFMYTLDEWANGSVGASVDAYKEQRIMAVSGIGNPQSFTQTLTISDIMWSIQCHLVIINNSKMMML